MSSDKPRKLLIKAKGGLGNRMLSAVTGLVYADLARRDPIIDWRDGAYAAPGVNAYPLLFDAPKSVDPSALETVKDVEPPIWRGELDHHPAEMVSRHDPKGHRNPFVYRRYSIDLTRPEDKHELGVFWSYVPKLKRMRSVMKRDPRFTRLSEREIYARYLERWFTPNQRVRSAVDATIGADRGPTIGVHIRYTDRTTPLHAFERKIEDALKEFQAPSIFLATDNSVVEQKFRTRFPNVFTIEKWFSPDGAPIHQNREAPDMVREAENALIDMWALSRCDRLIFSTRSTFSVTSALIGNFEPKNLVDVDARNLLVQAKRVFQDYA